MPAATLPAGRPAPRRRVAWAALVLLAALAASACQVRLSTGIVVDPDGSGVVHAGLGLDDEALAQLGDPGTRLRLDDLREAGWTVARPSREDDGLTWVRASRPFATPEEATRVTAQLSGPDGPFRDFLVTRGGAAWRPTTTFSGVVDLTGGLEGLGDADLGQRLDHNLGLGLDALRDRYGEALDDVVRVEVTVSVPGAAPSTWAVPLGQRQDLLLEGRRWDAAVAAPAAASVLLGAGTLLVLARRRRH